MVVLGFIGVVAVVAVYATGFVVLDSLRAEWWQKAFWPVVIPVQYLCDRFRQ